MTPELTATPKAKMCDKESPNIIPTAVDAEPRQAMSPSLTTLTSLATVVGESEYTNNAVARAALIAHTRAMMTIGLRGRVCLSVPLSRWGFSTSSAAAFISSR